MHIRCIPLVTSNPLAHSAGTAGTGATTRTGCRTTRRVMLRIISALRDFAVELDTTGAAGSR
ncbi:hypothetical protein ACWELJ_09295 [Nocardia sp. NPDC004582]